MELSSTLSRAWFHCSIESDLTSAGALTAAGIGAVPDVPALAATTAANRQLTAGPERSVVAFRYARHPFAFLHGHAGFGVLFDAETVLARLLRRKRHPRRVDFVGAV